MKAAFAGASVGLSVLVASLFVAAASCGSDSDTTPPGVKPDTATDSTPGDGGDTTVNPDSPDSPPPPDGDAGPCPTTPADGKIAELIDQASSKKITGGKGMRLTGAIVTSQKFIVSKSSTVGGTCLYGIFVADANATFQPFSGILVVSKGTPASAGETGGTFCSKGDLIPDSVAVGDKINVTGTYDPFGPTAATCGKATPPLVRESPLRLPSTIFAPLLKSDLRCGRSR